jgi:hypothetical protein
VLAHVEIPESDSGLHYLTIVNQQGCVVEHIHVNGADVQRDDQGRIAIDVAVNQDYIIDVFCTRGNAKK